MKTIIGAVLFLSLSTAVLAQGVMPDGETLEKIFAESPRATPAAIVRAKVKIAEFKRTLSAVHRSTIDPQAAAKTLKGKVFVYPSKGEKDEDIKHAETMIDIATQYLRLLEKKEVIAWPILGEGFFADGKFGKPAFPLYIFQVVDGDKIIIGRNEHWLLKGIPTKGLSDGGSLEFDDPIFFSGSYQYATVGGGQRTIPVAQPVNVIGVNKKYAERQASNK